MNFPSTPQEIDGNLHGSRTQSVARATGLVAVRTKGEAQATVEVTHAYIVLVAPKSANTLLRCARCTFRSHLDTGLTESKGH